MIYMASRFWRMRNLATHHAVHPRPLLLLRDRGVTLRSLTADTFTRSCSSLPRSSEPSTMPLPDALSYCLPIAYRCDQDSYLVVRFLDGHVEHVPGPRQLWLNRWLHESMCVERFKRYIASEKQCIDITHRDGRFERLLGPSAAGAARPEAPACKDCGMSRPAVCRVRRPDASI